MYHSLVLGERRGQAKAEPTHGTHVGGFFAAGTSAVSSAASATSPGTAPAASASATSAIRSHFPMARPSLRSRAKQTAAINADAVTYARAPMASLTCTSTIAVPVDRKRVQP